jgi:hypothetical protein
VAKYLASMGKPIPEQLLRQIAEDSRKEVEEDVFNKVSPNSNTNHGEEEEEEEQGEEEQGEQRQGQGQRQRQRQVQYYQHQMQQMQQMQQPIRMPPPNKFSPLYAQYIGQQPRAQASARVGLGGYRR